jgi:hypothetical protein
MDEEVTERGGRFGRCMEAVNHWANTRTAKAAVRARRAPTRGDHGLDPCPWLSTYDRKSTDDCSMRVQRMGSGNHKGLQP